MLRVLLGRAGGGVLVALGLSALAAGALPTAALALPAGRVYEMVSPVYKGGYGANLIKGVAADGEAVAFFSPGRVCGGAEWPDRLSRSPRPIGLVDDAAGSSGRAAQLRG